MSEEQEGSGEPRSGWRHAGRAEKALALAVLLFAASLPLSIAASQTALAAASLAWLALPRGRRVLAWRLLLPAAAYSLWSLASAVLSDAPRESLLDARDLVLFAVLLVVPPAARLLGASTGRVPLLAGATLAACWGLLDYASTPGGLLYRTSGPYGHYMTFGGMLMLVLTAALAEPLVRGWRALGRAPTLARALPVPLLLAALAASYARNAWLGLVAGLTLMVLVACPRLVWVIPVVVTLAVVASPQSIRERLFSIVNPWHPQNVERVYLAGSGLRMIEAHPLFGLGPGRVPVHYPAFRHPEAPHREPSHLHSNPLQIAAERGIPALGAWLALMGMAAWEGLGVWRRRTDRIGALGTLGAVAALLVAGLFEYNFGDSEVNMLFLYLVALPLGARVP